MPLASQITRVQIREYKSISACDVELGPLTFLVGPNGSGKSNFLDALRFIADCLNHSVEQALRDRGGINDVRRRSEGRPRHFGIRLDFSRADRAGTFAVEIGDRKGGGFTIRRESCEVTFPGPGAPRRAEYSAEAGRLVKLSSVVPGRDFPEGEDRLQLGTLAALPDFRPAYDILASMGFYRLNPDRIRDLQAPESGELLARDGSNAASVLAHLAKRYPAQKVRLEEFLGAVAPSVCHVKAKALGPRETVEFQERSDISSKPRRFLASSMSDGTLRALGILLALFQSPNGAGRVSLVGIEEPEAALHPGAAAVLMDALREASSSRQIIATSHGSDLLDSVDLEADAILAVSAEQGTTRIGPLGREEREVLRKRLQTAGDLLRNYPLAPDAKLPQPISR